MAFLNNKLVPKRRLFLLGVAFGCLLLFVAVTLRSTPELAAGVSNAVPVDLIEVSPQQIAPTIEGFGRVEPKHTWQAIAEVSGRITYRHPELYKGEMLRQGTVLLRVDPTDYEISLAEAEADFQAIEVELEGIALQKQNTELSLQIEQQSLVLAENEYERKQKLQKQSLISQSALDLENKSLLQQRQTVLSLQNQLKLLPNQQELLLAKLKQAEARLAEAKRLLEKTEIVLPETSRIAVVNVELDQVVSMNQSLLTAHGISVMNVNTQVSIHDMRTLVSSLDFDNSANFAVQQILKLGLTAELVLEGFQFNFRWPAKLSRVSETVDPSQATVGLFLEVEQDYREIRPSQKPPLTNGMFIRAEITGKPQSVWLLPLKALHGNRLYLMGAEQRLRIVPAQIRFFKEQMVAVDASLKPGDLVITTDLLPAVEGMLLNEVNREVQP